MSRRLFALLATLALLASACGDDDTAGETDDDDTSTTTSTTAPPDDADDDDDEATTTTSEAPELSASDVGVTAEAIKVGIMVADQELILNLGVELGWGDIEAKWRLAIEALNDAGGVLGRRLEPVFEFYLPTGLDDAACTRLTEDEKAFVVFGFIRPVNSTICFTDLHEVPVIATGDRLTPEVQERSAVPALFLATSPARVDAAMVAALEATGGLEGRTIAVHGRDEGRLDALESELEGLGYEAATRTLLTAPENDSLALDSDLDTIVEVWRSEGVDLVLNVTTSIALAGALERKAFDVDIVTTEGDILLDDRDGRGGTPDQFERIRVVGGLGSSRLIESGHVPSVECRERWDTAHPEEPTVLDPTDGELQNLGVTLTACATVELFAAIATVAGVDLTHESFAASLDEVGSVELAGISAASVGADKWDVPDLPVVSFFGWNAADSAYDPVGDPIELG